MMKLTRNKKYLRQYLCLFSLVITVIIAPVFVGCGNNGVNSTSGKGWQFNSDINYGLFTDSRDGKNYRTVRIGNRTWMAENLNYNVSNYSWCYGNSASYCASYGRLYNWYAAMSACPTGWRLPTDTDWDDLFQSAGDQDIAAEKLKSQTGWNNKGNGTDELGFSALPSGYGRSCHRTFIGAGLSAFWWSATDFGAWVIGSDYDGIETNAIGPQAGLSVRCVRE